MAKLMICKFMLSFIVLIRLSFSCINLPGEVICSATTTMHSSLLGRIPAQNSFVEGYTSLSYICRVTMNPFPSRPIYISLALPN